jgi:hypothetical protein
MFADVGSWVRKLPLSVDTQAALLGAPRPVGGCRHIAKRRYTLSRRVRFASKDRQSSMRARVSGSGSVKRIDLPLFRVC